ncbi:hypothetical protein B9G54_07435 [Alloscardovia macacae]|uniref:site-specific DNA-methyltransferase (adenine-specific) n=1 Tax=Alloscardovia macacae TaxID=1160091 RepID=A0A1Y2SWI4_9BIFI|nr:DNA adenine methylase [Alloscardovia macacae]OTA25516.1 hypothetical protein B9G54_07435 [Alloscardovia macacae]OTA28083.1 hypothetical protein B9T39_07455 [Alloscardovia macacae]
MKNVLPTTTNVALAPTLLPIRRDALMNTKTQPFPYQGSKRSLAPTIIPLMGVCGRVVEPFAGSAAVSIAARATGVAGPGVIADVNAPLMDLWREILSAPEELADAYSELWMAQQDNPKAFFNMVRDRFNDTPAPADFLYLLNRIVKGALRYGRDGRMNQGPDNRRLGAKPDVVRTRLRRVSELMAGTEVVTSSYDKVLTSVNPDTDVVYMDPPYQGTTVSRDRRYISGLSRTDLEEQLALLIKRGVRFIVSYDAITTDDKYGEPLDPALGLTHVHVTSGTSAQGTLVGNTHMSVESLYLSPTLAANLHVGEQATIEAYLF